MTALGLSVLLGLMPHDTWLVDRALGQGAQLRQGDLYTITYRVQIAGGKEIANSQLRGLPFSKELGDGHDGYFDQWVQGMSVGGRREIHLPAAAIPASLRHLLPDSRDVLVTLQVVAIKSSRAR